MDATDIVDQAISGWNPVSTSIWILLFAVIVVILVLGMEFWRNVFGILGSPSITFQRLIGEVSLPPALFVVIISGFLMAIVLLAGWTNPHTGDAVKAHFNIAFDWMGEKAAESQGMLPEQIDFRAWFNNLQRDFMSMLVFFALIPIGCLIVWFLGSLGFHLASLLAGNKGGGSIGGMLTASAYPYMLFALILVFLLKLIFVHTGWFSMLLLILFTLYFLFLWTILMREYGRFDYVKGFISFIIGVIVTAIFVGIVAYGITWLIALGVEYLG